MSRNAAGRGSDVDYIVVGGGSAGCTVAGRLGEDRSLPGSPGASLAQAMAGARDRAA